MAATIVFELCTFSYYFTCINLFLRCTDFFLFFQAKMEGKSYSTV
jgi:hypothetical protein